MQNIKKEQLTCTATFVTKMLVSKERVIRLPILQLSYKSFSQPTDFVQLKSAVFKTVQRVYLSRFSFATHILKDQSSVIIRGT